MSLRAILLLFLTLFCACTEVQVRTPNPHIEPPELRGDQGSKIGVTLWGAHDYKATDDGSARPPDLSAPSTFGNLDLDGSYNYSPASPVEFGVELHPFAGVSAVARLQVAGEGTRASKPGDVPVSLYARVGTAFGSQSGDQKGVFGPGGYNWKGSINTDYVHAGISTGYRTGEHVEVFGGVAVGQYWNKTEIDQDPNTGAADPGGVYKTGDSGSAQTGGAGLYFSWTHVQFYLTGEYTHIAYHKTAAENDVFLSGGLTITPR